MMQRGRVFKITGLCRRIPALTLVFSGSPWR
jgi:hypothetical protein